MKKQHKKRSRSNSWTFKSRRSRRTNSRSCSRYRQSSRSQTRQDDSAASNDRKSAEVKNPNEEFDTESTNEVENDSHQPDPPQPQDPPQPNEDEAMSDTSLTLQDNSEAEVSTPTPSEENRLLEDPSPATTETNTTSSPTATTATTSSDPRGTKCPVCLNIRFFQTTLPCKHMICLTCVKYMLDPQITDRSDIIEGKIYCPVCRQPCIQKTKGNVKDFDAVDEQPTESDSSQAAMTVQNIRQLQQNNNNSMNVASTNMVDRWLRENASSPTDSIIEVTRIINTTSAPPVYRQNDNSNTRVFTTNKRPIVTARSHTRAAPALPPPPPPPPPPRPQCKSPYRAQPPPLPSASPISTSSTLALQTFNDETFLSDDEEENQMIQHFARTTVRRYDTSTRQTNANQPGPSTAPQANSNIRARQTSSNRAGPSTESQSTRRRIVYSDNSTSASNDQHSSNSSENNTDIKTVLNIVNMQCRHNATPYRNIFRDLIKICRFFNNSFCTNNKSIKHDCYGCVRNNIFMSHICRYCLTCLNIFSNHPEKTCKLKEFLNNKKKSS